MGRHKNMLYHMAKTKMSAKKEYSVLYRLVNELEMNRLEPLLNVFTSVRLKRIQIHKSFKYSSFRLRAKTKFKFLSQCQFKLQRTSDEAIDESVENGIIYFKYSDEVIIKQNGKFDI